MKQIPPDRPLRGVPYPGGYNEDGDGPGLVETNVMYLNKHAEEWAPPFGSHLHLHLMHANSRVHWQVATRGSLVCKIPGRCHKAFIAPAFIRKGD